MTTVAIDDTDGQSAGKAADSSPDTVVDGLAAEVAELREAQSRLRSLLTVSRSLVDSLSAREIAQHLVEAACATAGARYARLELDGVDNSTPRLIEHAAEEQRLAYYQHYYLEQQGRSSSDSESRGHRGGLSEFGVGLDNGRHRLGTLQVYDRSRGGSFTPLTKELVSTLAATATIILDRAFHYEQVQQRALWMEAMRRIEALVIGSEEDELTVWREIATCVQRLTASCTVVLQVPDGHDDMHVLIAVGDGAEGLVGKSYPKKESLGWRAMQEGRGQVLSSGKQLPRRWHSLVDPRHIGPLMSVPLVGDSGPRGAVNLVRELGQAPFSDTDLELVEDFARQAIVALELAEARSARNRLKQTEAREAIARDLHDHVIQRLFAVGLSLQSVARAEPAAMQQQVQQSVQDLDATIAQIRQTIFTLRTEE